MSVPPNEVPPIDVVTPPPAYTGVASADEKQWALFAHLSAFAGFVIPFGNVVGPLVIWLIKKDTLPYLNDQGKEALNFNITLVLLGIALITLTFITFGLGIFLAAPIGVVAFIGWFILVILAAINASNGANYRYPLSLRLIK